MEIIGYRWFRKALVYGGLFTPPACDIMGMTHVPHDSEKDLRAPFPLALTLAWALGGMTFLPPASCNGCWCCRWRWNMEVTST